MLRPKNETSPINEKNLAVEAMVFFFFKKKHYYCVYFKFFFFFR